MRGVMLISNAHAGSVSARTKEVIAKALAADFKLEVVDTQRRNHASDLAAEAGAAGFAAVLAFGGDGTVNEVAQGLVGTQTALGILPGGTTNVMARTLGMPRDPVEATAFVAARLRSETRRRINVGRVGDRFFLFSCGMGLDAEVVKRVEGNPDAKRRWGEWFFLASALRAGATDYRGAKARIRIEVGDAEQRGAVLVVCCNARPFTYFHRFPVDACPHARLDAGLDVFGLERIRLATIPRVIYSVFVSRSHPTWRSGVYHHDVDRAVLDCDVALPVQVDGDYIGDFAGAELALVPQALDLLA